MQLSKQLKRERKLAAERSSKCWGTVSVSLDILCFPNSGEKENVDSLVKLFREDFRGLNPLYHIPAKIDKQQLEAALETSKLTFERLKAGADKDGYPELHFPAGFRLKCYRGLHRAQAARIALGSGARRWPVDLYHSDIHADLEVDLIDDYSAERVPEDGEIYTKIRRFSGYHSRADSFLENRWWARLERISTMKKMNMQRIINNPKFRAAFDIQIDIPGLQGGMKLGNIHVIFAMPCPNLLLYYLENEFRQVWVEDLCDNDPDIMQRMDRTTVEAFENTAPGASKLDRDILQAKIQSREILGNFNEQEQTVIWNRMLSATTHRLMPSLSAFFDNANYWEGPVSCLMRLVDVPRPKDVFSALSDHFEDVNQQSGECFVQESESVLTIFPGGRADRLELGLRGLVAWAMRNWTNTPRRKKRKENVLLETPEYKESASAVYELASLAFQLGFESGKICDLLRQLPEKVIARNALLEARPEDRFLYENFEFCENQVMAIFKNAREVPPGEAMAVAEMDNPVKLVNRFGKPSVAETKQTKSLLFVGKLHKKENLDEITPFFVRRSVYLAFFGEPEFDHVNISPKRRVRLENMVTIAEATTGREEELQGKERLLEEEKLRHEQNMEAERNRLNQDFQGRLEAEQKRLSEEFNRRLNEKENKFKEDLTRFHHDEAEKTKKRNEDLDAQFKRQLEEQLGQEKKKLDLQFEKQASESKQQLEERDRERQLKTNDEIIILKREHDAQLEEERLKAKQAEEQLQEEREMAQQEAALRFTGAGKLKQAEEEIVKLKEALEQLSDEKERLSQESIQRLSENHEVNCSEQEKLKEQLVRMEYEKEMLSKEMMQRLDEKDESVSQLNAKLEKETDQHKRTSQCLDESNKQNENLNTQLEEQKNMVNKLQQQLKDQDLQITARERQADERESLFTARERQADERESMLAARERQADERGNRTKENEERFLEEKNEFIEMVQQKQRAMALEEEHNRRKEQRLDAELEGVSNKEQRLNAELKRLSNEEREKKEKESKEKQRQQFQTQQQFTFIHEQPSTLEESRDSQRGRQQQLVFAQQRLAENAAESPQLIEEIRRQATKQPMAERKTSGTDGDYQRKPPEDSGDIRPQPSGTKRARIEGQQNTGQSNHPDNRTKKRPQRPKGLHDAQGKRNTQINLQAILEDPKNVGGVDQSDRSRDDPIKFIIHESDGIREETIPAMEVERVALNYRKEGIKIYNEKGLALNPMTCYGDVTGDGTRVIVVHSPNPMANDKSRKRRALERER